MAMKTKSMLLWVAGKLTLVDENKISLGSMWMYTDVSIPAAQVLALNATPRTLVAAPGAGLALVFHGAVCHKPAGTAYAGVAVGEDLAIKYTDGSGLDLGQLELTGFADQTTAQTRILRPVVQGTAPVSSYTPVANSPLVAQIVVGEITTGDSPFNFRVFYSIVPAVIA